MAIKRERLVVVSNSMTLFCLDGQEDALRHHGRPKNFNSDRGAQFTSTASIAKASSKATATTKAKAKPGQRRPAASEVECTA
jgi:hypothetical protein